MAPKPLTLEGFLKLNRVSASAIEEIVLLNGIDVPHDLISQIDNLKAHNFTLLEKNQQSQLLDFILHCLRRGISLEDATNTNYENWKRRSERMNSTINNYKFKKTLSELGASDLDIAHLEDKHGIWSLSDLIDEKIDLQKPINQVSEHCRSICFVIAVYLKTKIREGDMEICSKFSIGLFVIWAYKYQDHEFANALVSSPDLLASPYELSQDSDQSFQTTHQGNTSIKRPQIDPPTQQMFLNDVASPSSLDSQSVKTQLFTNSVSTPKKRKTVPVPPSEQEK